MKELRKKVMVLGRGCRFGIESLVLDSYFQKAYQLACPLYSTVDPAL
jgi:hypothetical protein